MIPERETLIPVRKATIPAHETVFLYSKAQQYYKSLLLNDLNIRSKNGGTKTTPFGFVGGTLVIL